MHTNNPAFDNINHAFFITVVTLKANDYVQNIDHNRREVITESKMRFSYDKLCLCHGARPKLITPYFKTDASKYVIGIRDTESVATFQEKLKTSKRICIVGNGGIATEMVYELQAVDIVWAIKDDSIATTFFDPGAAEFFISDFYEKSVHNDEHNIPTKRMKYTVSSQNCSIKRCTDGGALGPDWHGQIHTKGFTEDGLKRVHVEYNCDIKRILSREEFKQENLTCTVHSFQRIITLNKILEDTNWNVYIELNNGKIFGCDFIVSATGVIPNGDKIKLQNREESDFELTSDNAIKVNEQMETNIKGIYAAGDVCHANWKSSNHWFQMRLWTQARQMGMFAAQCMYTSLQSHGVEKKDLDFCFEMFTHATNFFGYKVILLGLFNGQKEIDYEILLRVTRGKEYVKCVMSKDGRMQGAILIGETDLEETFENLILNQMDLSVYGADLLDPNIDIEDYFD